MADVERENPSALAYLRAKKVEYFGVIFTQQLDSVLFGSLLEFLDRQVLLTIPVDEEVRRRIESAAVPQLVALTILEAESFSRWNFRLTLEREFSSLVNSQQVQVSVEEERRRGLSGPLEWYPDPPWSWSLSRRAADGNGNVAQESKYLELTSQVHLQIQELEELRDPLMMENFYDCVKQIVVQSVGHQSMAVWIDDLVQEVILRLSARKLQRLLPLTSQSAKAFWNYVSALCRSLLLDSMRTTATAPPVVSLDSRNHNTADPKAEGVFIREEVNELVRSALTELPDAHRKVIELIYFRHLKSREIAKLLGIAPSRVHTLRNRAIRRLRASMAHG